MTTATLDRVVTRQSGRKAARTDYVYVVTFHLGGSSSVITSTRTLAGAKREVSGWHGNAIRFSKFPRGRMSTSWFSKDTLTQYDGSEYFYQIVRTALHN